MSAKSIKVSGWGQGLLGYADQRAHDVTWMTTEERANQNEFMSSFAALQELADAEEWEA